MEFNLSEEQSLLIETTKSFVKNELLQHEELLEKTDIYLAVNDFPMDEATKEAWATYRRELRDLPNKYPNPQWGDDGKITNMIWPRNPDGYSDPSEIFEVLR